MHLKRLTILKEMLQTLSQHFPNSRFNINTWTTSCGTVACAAGFAMKYKPLMDEGLFDLSNAPCFEDKTGRHHGLEALEAFFHLQEKDAYFIFMPISYKEDFPSPEQVISHIEYIIERKLPCDV